MEHTTIAVDSVCPVPSRDDGDGLRLPRPPPESARDSDGREPDPLASVTSGF